MAILSPMYLYRSGRKCRVRLFGHEDSLVVHTQELTELHKGVQMDVPIRYRVREGDKFEVGIGRGDDRIIACRVERQLHTQVPAIGRVQATVGRVGIYPGVLKVETVDVL